MEFLSDKERCDHVVNAPTPVKTSHHNLILDRLAQQKSLAQHDSVNIHCHVIRSVQ